MSRDRDLAEAVRSELASIDPPRSCCRAAERDGLGAAAEGRARSAAVARAAVRLADETAEGLDAFDWDGARDHCRSSWLRGRFLATGSLSIGPGGMHLEFVLPLGEGSELVRRLRDAEFEAELRVRRARDVITWKRTEAILAFLRFCGASASVLEIESRLVERQLHGHLNRVLNAETANLRRSVASSARQVALIGRLEATGRLAELETIERAVARARTEAPEASFTELADRTGLSRSRVQRAFLRLESAARTEGVDGDL